MMLTRILPVVALLIIASVAGAQNITISSVTPAPGVAYVPRNSNISVAFSQTINGATLTASNVIVRGSYTGVIAGALSGGGTNTITFNPTNDFRLGEVVSITITRNLLGTPSGLGLVRGHTYSFTTAVGISESTPVQFGQRSITFTSGLSPNDIKTLDVENDGDIDLVLGSAVAFGDQTVLWTNDGNQKFCSQDIGNNRIAGMDDLDGDGDKDMVSLTGNSQGLSWNRNDGGGVFTPVVINATVLQVYGAQKNGDLDSDGDVDFIAAVPGVGQAIRWYENNGAGNFTPRVVHAGATGGNSYLNIADIDTDGDIDVVAYREDVSTFSWYENDGAQVFTEHIIVTLTTATTFLEMTVADLDDDGDMDILTGNANNGERLVWYNNDGNENFTGQDIAIDPMVAATKPKVIDIDGDLDRDIMTGGQWMENNGSNVFTPHKLGEQLQQASSVDYADMDGDGDMDLVTGGNALQKQFLWFENTKLMHVTSVSPKNASNVASANSDITITFDQPIDPATVNVNSVVVKREYRGVVAGGYTVSGNTITFNPASDFMPGEEISIAINDVLRSTSKHSLEKNYRFDFVIKVPIAGTPTFATNPIIHTYGAVTLAMDVADMDNDGDLDLVSCTGTELNWHRNDGTGNFASILLTTVGTNAPIALSDYNRDGRMDILTRNTAGFSGIVYLNDATQTFATTIVSPRLLFAAAVVADVDGDGFDDNLGTGYNHYNCNTINSAGPTGSSVAGDFDSDGDVDFIALTSSNQLARHDGAHGFLRSSIILTGAASVARGDLDGDGDYEAIFPFASTTTFWYKNELNAAANAFTGGQSIPSIGESRSVAVADFDGDGDMDIAGAGQRYGATVVRNRLNEASANFALSQTLIAPAAVPMIIRSGDINNDGRLDLVVVSNTDNTIRWFSNSGPVTPLPTITSLNGASGSEGDAVFVNGTNFSPTPANNTVRFNGTLTTVATASATQLRVEVPAGATTGFVTVVVGGNTATSPVQFVVLPNILDFQPNSGQVGTQVILTGTSFGATPALNKVYFDGTEAVVTAATTTSITTTVPPGASTGYIEVHTAAGIGSTDDSDFVVLPGPGGGANAPVIETQLLTTVIGGVVTIDLLPLITADDLDLASLVVSTAPASGASASIDSEGVLTIDYTGISFSGSEIFEITACDFNGECSTQVFDIEVAGDVLVFNAISPEGKNPIFLIQSIDVLPETRDNKVSIFNRWGDVVFEVSNYNNSTNVFAGKSTDGVRLPSGTYFYRVSFTSGRKTLTGYLELRY